MELKNCKQITRGDEFLQKRRVGGSRFDKSTKIVSVVGDLFKVIPQLIEELKKHKGT
jgi:hypothetical protein